MIRGNPFLAVIFDMDGVLTKTADLHEQAWKSVFDDFLQKMENQRPFTSADYRAHVDGKPRYQGVEYFLSSRGFKIPYGRPSDNSDQKTVYGLGNHKNEIFLGLLESEGVQVFEDAIAGLTRWQRGGMKLAVISSSRNCRYVLQAADLEYRLDVVVDGQVAVEENLQGKPEIMLEAARRLDIPPSDSVVLEDATAGIRAGRKGNFGLVVGVSRTGNDNDLKEAGADVVVNDVYRVRFPRRLPNALDRLEEISNWRKQRPRAIFLDFDGTLTPIVKEPIEPRMSAEMKSAIENLNFPVAIISGRDREDVQNRVGMEGIFYAGNHGFDIAGGGHRHTLPEADYAISDLDKAEKELKQRIGHLTGVILERKRYSLAVHYRQVESSSMVKRVFAAVESVKERTGLRRRTGKKVLELEPAVDWNKGRAMRWLVDVMPLSNPEEAFIIYIGDDETDEDAFTILREDGPGIRVGNKIASSLADYHVQNSDEVLQFLRLIAD